MKKFVLFSVSAIFALALIFFACQKETSNDASSKPNKAVNLSDVGIYYDFVEGGYLLNEQAVKSHNLVVISTTFNNGEVWEAYKSDGSSNSSVYDIYVNHDDKEYSSFCGSYASNAFGGLTECYESGELDAVKGARIISALNYIYDNYGSLNGWVEFSPQGEITPENATKVIAQCVIWMILDYVDVDGNPVQPQNGIVSVYPQYAQPGVEYRWYADKGFDVVIDAAYAAGMSGYTGSETVKSLAYLVGPQYPSDIVSWQPQIIPLGGITPTTTTITGPSWGTVTALASDDYTEWVNLPLSSKFDKKNNPINIKYIVPNANHFTCAKLTRTQLEEGVELTLVVDNKVDKVGTAVVKLNQTTGMIDITINKINEQACKFGVLAFTNLAGTPNNGNIHSINKLADMQKLGAAPNVSKFDHNNPKSIPCPAGNIIYIYLHGNPMQFFL
ncbi:MAG: hypothetical protein LBI45_07065 [Bacteroidales bacterium]|jgi:hypothetical protein|nr:hypothetical protein [Bacteroidales bacterium]